MIVSVLVLHVTCLFCKLCNFIGVSVFNLLIINIGHGEVGLTMDGALLISQTMVYGFLEMFSDVIDEEL